MKNKPEAGISSGPVAQKKYYSIGEVCKLTNLESHVLRYWESQFLALRVKKNRAGNRVYKRNNIDLIFLLRHLLYERKFTIEGAKKEIDEMENNASDKVGKTYGLDSHYLAVIKKELKDLKMVFDKKQAEDV